MYALVEDGSISKLITNPKAMVIGDVRYPAKIFQLWSQSEKESIGIYEIVVDKTNYKDPEYYNNTDSSYSFADGQVTESWGTATAKELEDRNATDEDGVELNPIVVIEGLKTEKKKIVASQKVTTPSSNQTDANFDGEAILLETGEGDFLVMDGFDPHLAEPLDEFRKDRVREARGLIMGLYILGAGERILLEGEPAFETLVSHASVRFIEAERLVLNQTEATGDDAGDGIVLEGEPAFDTLGCHASV